MEEWKEYKLEDLGRIITGKTPSTACKEYYDGETPFLTPSDDLDVKHNYRTNKYLSKIGVESVRNFLLPSNTICVSCIGSDLGKVTITTQPTITNQQINSIIVNKEEFDVDFIYYSMKCLGKILKHHSKTSTAVPIINKTQFSNYRIKVPSLPTQQKIAAILSSLDDKIELNNKINENLEQQAQALFDEIFKEDEKDIFLGEVIETTSGGTPSRKNMAFYTNGNNCWVKSKELESGFIIDTEEKITNDAINNSAAKLLPENSVLIAMYGATVGAYGIISKPMTCNQAICALLPNENYPYTYLFMFAKNVTQELETLAVGSAQQNISQVLIKKLKVHSDTKKIKEFHSSTHAIFEQMLLIRQENKTLSELRDTLLPKLMNGEIEV